MAALKHWCIQYRNEQMRQLGWATGAFRHTLPRVLKLALDMRKGSVDALRIHSGIHSDIKLRLCNVKTKFTWPI